MISVGALLPLDRSRPPPPLDAMPMGRAARALLAEGVQVVLGDRAEDGALSGYAATPEGWIESDGVRVVGVYDRFPMLRFPEVHAALLRGLGGLPLGNPPSLRRLSRDKLRCQRHLVARGVSMPPIEGRPEHLDAALRAWGVAFAKPRYGAEGIGVSRCVAEASVPRTCRGPLGALEPTLLQRAVPPPVGWAGVATRTLTQRDASGAWVTGPPVARRSRTDCVVSVSRGAEVAAAEDVLAADTVDALIAGAVACASALSDHPDGGDLLEIGVDAVIDRSGVPWIIEVNTRPWGRLAALHATDPTRWGPAHVEACARPFRWLAARALRTE